MNNPMILASVKEDFYLNFIKDDRYLWLLDGLKTTLIITVFAVIVGLIIGFLVAIIRSAHDKSGSFKILNAICRVYLTVIRGTPTMIQLLIMNFVIFGAVSINKIIVGGLAFGINSGAYVAEIVRSGIMSIDQGQFEAGRSLGLNYTQTMTKIILPQAVKNILPALGNELIVLLKETSISGYIGLMDLTRGGDISLVIFEIRHAFLRNKLVKHSGSHCDSGAFGYVPTVSFVGQTLVFKSCAFS